MSSLQASYPRYLYHPSGGIYALPGHVHSGHFHPVLVRERNGTIHTKPPRTTKCSSPTTPPAERRAYAAREQARKETRPSAPGEESDSSNSASSKASHLRGSSRYYFHPIHGRSDSTEKLPTKTSQKIPHKSSKAPHSPDSDTESSYSNGGHAPVHSHSPHRLHPHHAYRHSHHGLAPEHYVIKVPVPTHCPDCCQSIAQHTPETVPAAKLRAHPPAEAPKEESRKSNAARTPHGNDSAKASGPSMARVVCHCGLVHFDVPSPQPQPQSQKAVPRENKHESRGKPVEREQVRPHRHRHTRYRKHRHHDSSSSSDTDLTEHDDTSSESSVDAQVGHARFGFEVPADDWEVCSEKCCGHPVFYIMR
ncbi:Uncharacterized protein PECH_003628 [Penicillium ucsense]|uniref:Uncharacterized protein n=1 Tax=Penicillium ucsense TaxID=2839758 RepID=A0A8J8WHX5_9EURO|nr:Uncharacterized protein PECM_006791 [Penicillium ucsense]KAF7729272.1 Uncharacterized protein PECH_003628 [Penicillium ucsense]